MLATRSNMPPSTTRPLAIASTFNVVSGTSKLPSQIHTPRITRAAEIMLDEHMRLSYSHCTVRMDMCWQVGKDATARGAHRIH